MAKHFILFSALLLSLLAYSVSGQVFWSVNCGESEDYTDVNGIPWTADETLVSNGFARVVQSSSKVSPVLDSLRVFTSRIKNCYSTPVTKGEKVLVRANFNYGNYDGLSTPPTFDLHFDGNFWSPVETSIDKVDRYEVIYVTKGDTLSVCVAQTKSNQFPFMSALEVRSVDSDVYDEVDEDRALFTITRFSFGASVSLRYPQDPYDRIWRAAIGADGTEKITSDAILVDATGTNRPPSGIFQNAITVNSKADSLLLFSVPPSTIPFYMTMYFSEVSNPDTTGQTRSFRFYETTTSSTTSISDPLSPPYGTMTERSLYNYTVDSLTNISLIATTDSDLPPIVNALELFLIGDVLTDGTDSNDVEALVLLQNTFDVLAEWSGDPCLPAPYSWDWLNCSDATPPRITSLFLDGFELLGTLPDISSMDALQIIDLHNNSLDGEIPSFLSTMTNLQQLNLADNDFSGPIPTTLSKNSKLKLNVTSNPSLCAPGKSCTSSPGTVNSSPGSVNSSPGSTGISRSKKKKSSPLPAVLGTTIPIFFLIWIAVGVFVILRKKKKQVNVNMPVAKGFTPGGANGYSGGGANGNSHNNGVEMTNETVDDAMPRTFASPSPLLNSDDQTSDLYGQTGVQNHEQP